MNILVVEDAAEHGVRLARFDVRLWPLPERIWFVSLVNDPIMRWPAIDEDELNQLAELFGGAGVDVAVTPMVRRSASELTDEDMEGMTHVARGAMYSPAMEGE